MKSFFEKLRPAAYQLVPLAKLLANSLEAILIADGVGVGKTISAAYISVYARANHAKPAFVVCTPTMIPKWLFELKSKFADEVIPVRSMDDLDTARSESAHRSLGSNQPVYVLSNSLMFRAKRDDYPPAAVAVFDEIHTYRNAATRWHKGCLELSRASTIRVGLTATPINNSIEDLVAELSILLPEYETDVVSVTIKDLWNSDKRALTSALVTRFVKEKLGIHFAKRVLTSVPVSYSESYVNRVKLAISNRMDKGTLLEQITYYRLAASSPAAFWSSMGLKARQEDDEDPKLAALVRILRETSITHWIVFCEFTETVEFLAKKLTDLHVFTMTGDTPIFERPSVVQSFQHVPGGVLILTSVGSEGLDLQFCGGIINYDLHWNPMKLEQRAGRIDRVGQERRSVRIVNFHVTNSIDERVLSVLRRKLDIISDSIFAPGSILVQESHMSQGPSLYSNEVVKHELETGASLVETFKLNQDLDAQDYAILSTVDTDLCDPRTLLTKSRSIRSTAVVHDPQWNQRLVENSIAIQKLLTYYA